MIWLTPTRVATLTLAMCLACVAMPAHATEVPANVRRAVNAALGNRGDGIAKLQTSIAIPADVELIVGEMVPDHSTGTTRIKLSCIPANRCLPFYVMAHGAGLIAPLAAHGPVSRRPPPEVRAGDKGALVNSSPSMRITLPVTALDAGRIGEIVRVRFEKRLTWRARVIGPGYFIALAEVH